MRKIILFSFLICMIIIGCDTKNKRPVTPMEFNHRVSIIKEKTEGLTYPEILFHSDEFLEIYDNPELFIDTIKHKLRYLHENGSIYHQSGDYAFYYDVLHFGMTKGSLCDYIDICDIVIEETGKGNLPSDFMYRLFMFIEERSLLYDNRYDRSVKKLVSRMFALENLDINIKIDIKNLMY